MKAARLLRPAMWSYALQRLCTWYPLRRVLSSAVAAMRPSHSTDKRTEAAELAHTLYRHGIAMLPSFVSAEVIERIKVHLRGARLNERFPPCRKNFTFESVPENVHVAEYDTDYILRCPDVVALANHPSLVGAAARYLHCKPTISNISIWWSLPAGGAPQEAENYHRDVDEWRFVKFFLYMTDVDDSGGPHCFVRGSHRSSRFLWIRRIRDEEIIRVFSPNDRLKITGRTGDAFLEDTFGLHKGQPPTGRPRLLLQVEYSINPIAVYNYSTKILPPDGPVIDGYINRLYFDRAH
jgi:hypothetical protein